MIIGIIFSSFSDWPLIIGGQKPENGTLAIDLFFVIGIGWLMTRSMGRWAGKMIVVVGKSPFLISFLTLTAIFIAMLLLSLNLSIMIFGVVILIILSRFMGYEIKRKGKQHDNTM